MLGHLSIRTVTSDSYAAAAVLLDSFRRVRLAPPDVGKSERD